VFDAVIKLAVVALHCFTTVLALVDKLLLIAVDDCIVKNPVVSVVVDCIIRHVPGVCIFNGVVHCVESSMVSHADHLLAFVCANPYPVWLRLALTLLLISLLR